MVSGQPRAAPPLAEGQGPPHVFILRAYPWGLEPRAVGASYPVLPVGLVALANLLVERGFRVQGVHLPLEHMVQPGLNLRRWLNSRSPAPLTLLDLHWYEHAAGVMEAARLLRAVWPQTRIVVGGLTASIFADQVLAACPEVDAVVAGDSETAVLTLAGLARQGQWPLAPMANVVLAAGRGAFVRGTTQTIFDSLDFAGLSWLRHGRLYRQLLYSHPLRGVGNPARGAQAQWVANGRGCVFDCSFCGGGRQVHRQVFGLHGLLARAPGAVLRDVARLSEAGVDQVALTLDPDVLPAGHGEAFFDGLAKAALRPGLYLESFQLPSRTVLDGLANHADLDHSELVLTALSGDKRVRRRNGKRFDDGALLATLAGLAQRDISATVFFSLNLPGEDRTTLEATLALAEQILAQDRQGQVRVANLCHTLDPLSPAWRDPGGFGLRAHDLEVLSSYLAYGVAARPFPMNESERGLVQGRDLAVMAQLWEAWCAAHPGRALGVGRV